MASPNHRDNRPQSMQERLAARSQRSLPDFLKWGSYACQAIPTIFLVLYTTGAWQARFDELGRLKDFDTIVSCLMVAFGVFGVAIQWFIQHLYEKE